MMKMNQDKSDFHRLDEASSSFPFPVFKKKKNRPNLSTVLSEPWNQRPFSVVQPFQSRKFPVVIF